MCGKGSNTTSTVTNSQPPAYVQNAYENLVNQATGVANTPLTQYGGPMVAGFNPTQENAFSNVNAAQGMAQPYINQGAGFAAQGAQAVWPNVQQYTPGNLQQYMSPYTNQVIGSTLATQQEQNAVQANSLLGQGIAQGNAFGGDRLGVAEGQLGLNQALASNQTIAGLENQGFAQGQQELNTQQNLQLQGMEGDAWRQANAGYELGGLGQEAEGTALQGASAQLQAGSLGQQLQQEQLNVPYEQFLQEQAYPFQTTQFLGEETGIASGGAGGTSTTTQPAPSTLGQIAGLGEAGLGLVGLTGGFGATGWLAGLGLKRGGRVRERIPMYDNGGRVPYDDGGTVDPSQQQAQEAPQGAPNPGAAPPVMMGANPILQQQYQRISGQSAEDLQRMAVMYPPTSPRGQMVRRALMAKRMAPASSTPATTQAPPTFNGTAGLPGFGAAQQQPQGYADGGVTQDPMMVFGGPMGNQQGGTGIPYDYSNPQVGDAYSTPAGPYPGSGGRVPTLRSPVDSSTVSRGVPRSQGPAVAPGYRGIPQTGADFSAGATGFDPGAGAVPTATTASSVGAPDETGVDADPGLDVAAMEPAPADPSPDASGDPTGGAGAPARAPGLRPTASSIPPALASGPPGTGRGTPSPQVISAIMAKGSTGNTESGAREPVPSWAMPLAVAGFAAMASRSPYAANAIGEGGLAAVNNYYEQLRYDRELAYKQFQMQNAAQRNQIYGRIADARTTEADAATKRANAATNPQPKPMTQYEGADLTLRGSEHADAQQLRLDGVAQSAYDRAMARIDNDPTTMSPGPARQAAIDAVGQQISRAYPKSSLAQSFSTQGAAGGSSPLPKGVTPAQAVAAANDFVKQHPDQRAAAAARLQKYGIDPSFLSP